MSPLKQVRFALEAYRNALDLINRQHWWRYALAPFILKLIAVVIMIALAITVQDQIYQLIKEAIAHSDIEWVRQLGEQLEDKDSLLAVIVSWAIHFSLWMISMKVNKYLALILLAPFLAWMAEKTEDVIGQGRGKTTIATWIKNALRGALISLCYAFLELMAVIALFIAGLLPVFGGLLAPVLLILGALVSFYFYGATFLDYGCERMNWSIAKSMRMNLSWKYAAVTLGALHAFFFGLLGFLPFVGEWLAISLIPMISVVAGVLLFQNLMQTRNVGP
ncbi:MAG: EI24 domain-containing protein [Flavobacteriales bacterium]